MPKCIVANSCVEKIVLRSRRFPIHSENVFTAGITVYPRVVCPACRDKTNLKFPYD